jgi:hypothetical protein
MFSIWPKILRLPTNSASIRAVSSKILPKATESKEEGYASIKVTEWTDDTSDEGPQTEYEIVQMLNQAADLQEATKVLQEPTPSGIQIKDAHTKGTIGSSSTITMVQTKK